MSAPPDYYRILHVQPDAPAADHSRELSHARAARARRLAAATNRAARRGVRRARRPATARRVRSRARRACAARAQRRTARTPTARHARTASSAATPHALERGLERDDECGRCASPLYPRRAPPARVLGPAHDAAHSEAARRSAFGDVAAGRADPRRDAQLVVERHGVRIGRALRAEPNRAHRLHGAARARAHRARRARHERRATASARASSS